MSQFPSRSADSLGLQEVGYRKADQIATITLNRPQHYNAYSTRALDELAAAFRDATFDDAVGVIVLTGAGHHAFCTGGDVKEYAADYVSTPRDYWKYMALFRAYIESILNTGKPVIARLNGMNDKCAAGTGRFLGAASSALEMSLDELGPTALRGERPVKISTTCTVFAESEVLAWIGRGKKIEDILLGVHQSIAARSVGLLRRVGVEPEVTFTGGVARNPAMIAALNERLELTVNVSEDSHFMAIYDPFYRPSNWPGAASAFSGRDLLFSFNVNAGFDVYPARPPFGECFSPSRIEPPISATGWDEAARAEAFAASRARVLDSLRTTLTLQLDAGLVDRRRGFFVTYINSFNEWHEGTAFEPALSFAALSPAQRAIGYHNPDEGRWRLQLVQDLIGELTRPALAREDRGRVGSGRNARMNAACEATRDQEGREICV